MAYAKNQFLCQKFRESKQLKMINKYNNVNCHLLKNRWDMSSF